MYDFIPRFRWINSASPPFFSETSRDPRESHDDQASNRSTPRRARTNRTPPTRRPNARFLRNSPVVIRLKCLTRLQIFRRNSLSFLLFPTGVTNATGSLRRFYQTPRTRNRRRPDDRSNLSNRSTRRRGYDVYQSVLSFDRMRVASSNPSTQAHVRPGKSFRSHTLPRRKADPPSRSSLEVRAPLVGDRIVLEGLIIIICINF